MSDNTMTFVNVRKERAKLEEAISKLLQEHNSAIRPTTRPTTDRLLLWIHATR